MSESTQSTNWEALRRYARDGDLEIDNNGAERSLRGMAVGRSNWTFFGSDQGGKMAAMLTSIMATRQRVKIDPFAYLRDVLCRIASHPIKTLDQLLPAHLEVGASLILHDRFRITLSSGTQHGFAGRVLCRHSDPTKFAQ